MAAIDGRIEDLDPASRALSHYAVGRGHLALGEAAQAHERLKLAWELGDRSPELNFALGLSLAELYRDAVEDAAAIRERPASGSEPCGGPSGPIGIPPASTWNEAREERNNPRSWPRPSPTSPATATRPSPTSKSSRRTTRSTTRAICSPDRSTAAHSRRRRAPATAKTTAASFALAETAFRAAARIGESDPRPYQQLCGLWVGALRNQFWESGGDLVPARDAALEACDQALIADPDSAAAHIEAGRAHRYWAGYEMYQGREDAEALAEARRHARAAIEAAPENPTPYVLLGVTHRIAANLLAARGEEPRDEFAGAVAAYREAIRLKPSDAGAHMSLASALLYLGDHARNHGQPADDYFEAAAEAAATGGGARTRGRRRPRQPRDRRDAARDLRPRPR